MDNLVLFLAVVGGFVCIVAVGVIVLLGLATIRDFVIDSYYGWKLTQVKREFDYNTEKLAIIHLQKLQKKYPDLEISYHQD